MEEKFYLCYHKDVFQDVLDILIQDIGNLNYNILPWGDFTNVLVRGSKINLDKLDYKLSEIGLGVNGPNERFLQLQNNKKIKLENSL